jgi:hypothetical protein
MTKSVTSFLLAALMVASGFATAQAPAAKADDGKTRAEVKTEAKANVMKDGKQGGSGPSGASDGKSDTTRAAVKEDAKAGAMKSGSPN